MDNLGLLKLRRSVRVFQNKKIPGKELERIVEAARYAPTARNVQPWEFVVIEDKDKLKELAGLAENARFMAQAAACIVVFCIDTKYYLEDGCAATCNILLAATALGIGSCWVAGDKKPYSGQVATLLNAPKDMKLVSLIALGYPQDKDAFGDVVKRQLKELIHWEKF
jgi:nitroreductase